MLYYSEKKLISIIPCVDFVLSQTVDHFSQPHVFFYHKYDQFSPILSCGSHF